MTNVPRNESDRAATVCSVEQAFPDMSGLSARHLNYMRALAIGWPNPQIVQRLVARSALGGNPTLLERLDDPATRQKGMHRGLLAGESNTTTNPAAAAAKLAWSFPEPDGDREIATESREGAGDSGELRHRCRARAGSATNHASGACTIEARP